MAQDLSALFFFSVIIRVCALHGQGIEANLLALFFFVKSVSIYILARKVLRYPREQERMSNSGRIALELVIAVEPVTLVAHCDPYGEE